MAPNFGHPTQDIPYWYITDGGENSHPRVEVPHVVIGPEVDRRHPAMRELRHVVDGLCIEFGAHYVRRFVLRRRRILPLTSRFLFASIRRAVARNCRLHRSSVATAASGTGRTGGIQRGAQLNVGPSTHMHGPNPQVEVINLSSDSE